MDVGIVVQQLSAHSLDELNLSLVDHSDTEVGGYSSSEVEFDELEQDQSRHYQDIFKIQEAESPFHLKSLHNDSDLHNNIQSTEKRNAFNSIANPCPRRVYSSTKSVSSTTHLSPDHALIKSPYIMPSLVTVKSDDLESSLKCFASRTSSSVFKVFRRYHCAGFEHHPIGGHLRHFVPSPSKEVLSGLNVERTRRDQSSPEYVRQIPEATGNCPMSLSDDEVSELFGKLPPPPPSLTFTAYPPSRVLPPLSMRDPWTRISLDVSARSESQCPQQAGQNKRWSIFQESHSCAPAATTTHTTTTDRVSEAIVIQRPSLDFDKMQRSCFGRKHVQNGINKPRAVKVRCFKSSCSVSDPAQLFDPAVFSFRSLSRHQQQQQRCSSGGGGPISAMHATPRDHNSSPAVSSSGAVVACGRCSAFIGPGKTTVKRSG